MNFDNFSKFGSGIGSIGSVLGGFGSLFGRRKAEKWMKKNFELQKEAMERNFEMQTKAQQMAADQFDRTMDFNTPATQRRMMEEAGINPFMKDSAVSAGNAHVGQTLNPTPLNAPQYDLNSVYQDEMARQSRVTNTVGNINGILDGVLKLGGLADNLKKLGAERKSAEVAADVAVSTTAIQKEMQQLLLDNQKQDLINKRTDNAIQELNLKFLPQEQSQRLAKMVAETDLLTKEGLYYDEKKKEVVANTAVLEQQRKNLLMQYEKLYHETVGVWLTNQEKAIVLKYAEERQRAEIDNIKASTTNFRENAAKLKKETEKLNHEVITAANDAWRSGLPRDPIELNDKLARGRHVPEGTIDYIEQMKELRDAQIFGSYTTSGATIGDFLIDTFIEEHPQYKEDYEKTKTTRNGKGQIQSETTERGSRSRKQNNGNKKRRR